MNDAIIQHHFDEVFNALHDRENFEIFTGAKRVSKPKIRRTLVKIVESSTQGGGGSASETDTEDSLTVAKYFGRQRRVETPEESGPSSRSSYSRRLFSPSLVKTGKIIELKNTLFECAYCKRYILGDFLNTHEEKCKQRKW